MPEGIKRIVKGMNDEWIVMLSTFIFFMEGTAISELMINEQIRDKEVRLIGESGEQLGLI